MFLDLALLALAIAVVNSGVDLVQRFLPTWKPAASAAGYALEAALVLLPVVYWVAGWTLFGRTAGKAILGLRVVGKKGGARPGLGRSLVRMAGYILSALPLYAGFLWVSVDADRRGWHDHLAGTRVIYDEGRRTRSPAGRELGELSAPPEPPAG
jgi:uncharacterized RDD family membrane protein YckC